MHEASSRVSPATSLLPWRQQQNRPFAGQQMHTRYYGRGICSKPSARCRAYTQTSREASCLLTAEVSSFAAVRGHNSGVAHTPEHHDIASSTAAPVASAAVANAAMPGRFTLGTDKTQGNTTSPTAAVSTGASRSLAVQAHPSVRDPPYTLHQESICHAGDQHLDPQVAGTPEAAAGRVWLPKKQLWIPQSSLNSTDAEVTTAATAGSAPSKQNGATAMARTLSRVYMGAAATRGQKKFMEDRHVVAALDPSQGVQQAHGAVGLQDKVSVAAVFDGHAGYATAAYAAQHIPQLLHEALSGRPGSRAEGGPRFPARGLLAPSAALASSFHWFDRWWADARCDPAFTQHGWDDSGSTAVVGMVCGRELVVANAGDSVALLARGNQSQRLTVEHRLDNAEEVERVLEAGGRVVSFKPGSVPRVMGSSSQTRFKGSMVTRSLGDFAFKHPQALISADPYVATQLLTPADRLVVMTSDGVTDVLPDDDMLGAAIDAIEQTQQSTNNGQALAKAAANAVMSAALESGSKDNITVVTILLDWDCEFSTD